MKNTALLAFLMLLTINGNAQDKINGNGKITTKKIETESYDRISITGFYDVNLIAGKEGQISIEGESNLLEYVSVSSQGGNLMITTQQGKNIRPSQSKSIVITVPFESLDAVSLTGSGDVVGKQPIKTDNFQASVTGSGDLKLMLDAKSTDAALTGSGDLVLSGKTQSLNCRLSGSGDFNGYELESGDVESAVSGSGDCKVYCNGNLEARVSGSGDIRYKGDPKKKDTKVSGSGSITKA